MVDKVDLSNRQAYTELLNSVPERLKERIEARKIVHRDILEIARSVFIKKEDDGSFSLSKNVLSEKEIRSSRVSSTQIDLIKELCSLQIEKSPVVKNRKRKPEEKPEVLTKKVKVEEESSVSIVRGGKKRKPSADPECDNLESTKKPRQDKETDEPQIKNDEDFFDVNKGLPDGLLFTAAEYLDIPAEMIVDLVKKGTAIPEYLKQLQTLNLRSESLDIDTFDTIITQFPNLKSLNIPENATNEWLEKIAEKLPNLTNLSFSCCQKITDISCLKAFTNLERLDISYCHNIDDPTPLRDLTSLTHLKVGCCKIANDFSILQFLTSLIYLDISQSAKDLTGISALTSLQHLDLSLSSVSDISELSALKDLTYLDLSSNRELSDISSLAQLIALTHLDVKYCENVTDAYGLVTLTNLTYLDLMMCEIPYDTSEVLLAALKNLVTITGTPDEPVEYDD